MNQQDQNEKENTGQGTGYQRPNQAWICGNASQACECPLGPLGPRKCGSRNEEQCSPRASLRTWRSRFTIAVTLAVTGIVLIGCWQPWRADFLAPGPLSSSHAQLFGHETANENRCAACHEAANTSPGDWLIDTLTGGNHIGVPQSTKCMACHEDTLAADLALAAHNVSEAGLSEVRQNLVSTDKSNSRIFRIADHLGDDIACAVCHREHHGKDHDLAALTDTQCQSCHQSQFESFALDHPDFGDWSTRVSLGIEFDHGSHLQKHFPDKQTAFDCQQCHVADARGDVQLLAGFETTCASCHEKSIEGNLSGGIQLVALPMLDIQQLNAAGVSVGNWPAQATGDFEGQLPPMMQVLLAGDPRGSQALESLGEDFDFYDLDTNNAEQIAAVTELVWSIKRMIADVTAGGEAEIRERLAVSLRQQKDFDSTAGSTVDEAILRLASQISIDAIVDLQTNWFPKLDEDLKSQPTSVLQAGLKKGSDPLRLTVDQTLQRTISSKSAPNTEPQGSDLFFKPENLQPIQQVAFQTDANEGELLLENPLKSRYQSNLPRVVPAGNGTDVASHGNAQLGNGRMRNHTVGNDVNEARNSNASVNTEQANTEQANTVQPKQRSPQIQTPPSSGNGTMLLENPLKSLVDGEQQPTAGPILQPKVDTPPVVDAPSGRQPVETNPRQAVREFVREQLKSQQLYPPANSKAGWVRNDESLTLAWQAGGHADPIVQAWLETLVSSGVANGSQTVLASAIRKELSTDSGTGYCLQCHGSNENASELANELVGNSSTSAVAWKASYRDPNRRSFTRFNHAPHVMQTSLNDCQCCHRIDTATARTASDSSTSETNPFKTVSLRRQATDSTPEPDPHHSDFIAIGKHNCVQCHNATAVSQSCTQCHGYHIGSRVLK